MEKHFLATISNEVDNLFGVRFICSFFSELAKHKVTILHICRESNKSSTSLVSTMWDGPEGKNSPQVSASTRKSISKAQDLLRTKQLPIGQVKIKTVPERYGKVKDILTESSLGLYDAIVLGRRASYALQWVFDRPADETFQSMIKDSNCVSPLWICPDLEPKRKNVLLCLDGSENCYRAVDHVGYMLSSEQQHSITLFHVEKDVDTKCVEYFQKAEKILLSHNISEKRFLRKITWGSSIAATIESEAVKGKYAVIAIGLRGQNNTASNHKIASKTATKLINSIEKASLWCCP